MSEFWRNRTVFLTGHTGFKGAWLCLWLREMGAEVVGYALAPDTTPNLFALIDCASRSIIGDIRDPGRLRSVMQETNPHIVVHMAAQALVRESYRDPLSTFASNIMGTANVLQACRDLPRLQGVLVVTSDKVYENDGAGRPFEEADRLGGHDPYSASKACAELVTVSIRDSFFAAGPPLATARAGNVIGGGDWSIDRLIPDCVRALHGATPVSLRYPEAVRPWQHVLDPLSGYIALAERLAASPPQAPQAVNFGPSPASFCTVREVVEAFSARFSGKPGWVRDPGEHPVEARHLTLSSSLAERSLGWQPRLGVNEALAWTADWYGAHAAGENMMSFSEKQLARYRALPGGAP